MTPFVHYKQIEGKIVDSINRKLRAGANETWRFARRAVMLGKQRVTILLVPYSEKKIFNFHLSVFSMVFAGLLFAAIIAVLFIARADIGNMSRLLSSSAGSLRNSQASLQQVQNRVGNLIQVSRVFETAMNQTMSSLGLRNRNVDDAPQIGPSPALAGVSGASSNTTLTEVAELRNLTSVMSSSVQSVKRVTAFYESHKRLLAELPTEWPVKGGRGIITTFFGPAIHPFTHRMYLHTGVDIAYSEGTPIVAAADGVVVSTAYQPLGYGNNVFLRHAFGFYTRYAHLMRIYVHEGEHVKQGQVIGLLGTTGLSTGPHVHFEVWLGNQVIDPMRFLNISGHHTSATMISQD